MQSSSQLTPPKALPHPPYPFYRAWYTAQASQTGPRLQRRAEGLRKRLTSLHNAPFQHSHSCIQGWCFTLWPQGERYVGPTMASPQRVQDRLLQIYISDILKLLQ